LERLLTIPASYADQGKFTNLFWNGSLVAWFAGISGIVYCLIGYPLAVTAGKQTGINIALESIVSAKVEFILSLTTAAAFGILWRRERKLHRDDVRRFTTRIRELESHLDKGRSSSGLTETGDHPRGVK
jgi:hypothetical protein